jgi:hypothetical protein
LLLSVCLLHAGARTELLHIAERLSGRLQDAAADSQPGDRPSSEDSAVARPASLQPLPTPDAQGVIELNGAEAYAAGEIAAVGALTIRCTAAEQAVIIVRDRPLRIWAERIVLDNLVIRTDEANSGSSPSTAAGESLLVVDTQELAMRRCTYLSAGELHAAVIWSALDPDSAAPQRLLVRESVFHGPGDALQVDAPATAVDLNNVLKTGRGTLLRLRGAALGSPRPLVGNAGQVTLREADGFVRCELDNEQPVLRPLELTFQDCVLDIAVSDGALLQFDALELPHDWPMQVRIGGEGSVLHPETRLAGHRKNYEGAMVPLDAGQMAIEGLQFADFSFAGPDDAVPENALAVGEFGYRRSSRPPGIDPAALPRAPVGTYNSERVNQTAQPGQQATR